MTNFLNESEASKAIFEAMRSGDEEQIKQAWKLFHESVVSELKATMHEAMESNDSTILAQRGFRQLTSVETKFYQNVIESLKGNNPKQAFITTIADGVMPTTIIEDVFKHLRDNHPLLKLINFQYTGAAAKWVITDAAAQTAVWGPINSAITKEVTSAFKVVDVKNCKLSAFALLDMGMLDLGPAFLDAYVRAVLTEAIAITLEQGIIAGNGKDQPIGLNRDIHDGVEVNSHTGYPEKSATAIKSFSQKEYGEMIAPMAKTEKGRNRNFVKVYLLCNLTTFLKRVMPASTLLTATGTYARDIFPFPTEVVITNALADDRGIASPLGDEYFASLGNDKKGTVEYSDEYKFFEDQRAFKTKLYASGSAFDNTSAVYLDLSKLEPAVLMFKEVTAAPAAAAASTEKK